MSSSNAVPGSGGHPQSQGKLLFARILLHASGDLQDDQVQAQFVNLEGYLAPLHDMVVFLTWIT